MAAAATDFGKIVIEPDLEREDGNRGGDDVFPAPAELGVVAMAAEAHQPGLFIGRQWRFAVARSFLRRPIFFRHMRAALARGRLRTMRWLPPCSLAAPVRSIPREVSSMALVGSSSRLSDCVDVLCCTRAREGRGKELMG
jgi:hypothetical protein